MAASLASPDVAASFCRASVDDARPYVVHLETCDAAASARPIVDRSCAAVGRGAVAVAALCCAGLAAVPVVAVVGAAAVRARPAAAVAAAAATTAAAAAAAGCMGCAATAMAPDSARAAPSDWALGGEALGYSPATVTPSFCFAYSTWRFIGNGWCKGNRFPNGVRAPTPRKYIALQLIDKYGRPFFSFASFSFDSLSTMVTDCYCSLITFLVVNALARCLRRRFTYSMW